MDNQPTIGAKPAEGFTGKNAAENKIYRYDETGRMIDSYGVSHPAFDKTANADLTNTSARIGDYVIQNGQPVAVPNSPTDLIQKYKIAVGGTESPSYNPSLSVEGGGAVTGAAVGASILGMVGGPLGAGIGAAIGALGGSLSAHNAAAEEALRNWQKENVKYDTAVEFYRDENGALKYKLDYQKMGTGGPRSGEGVKEAQNRETEVTLGDDGRLKVTVSPIFASTARFQELVEWISENYAGLTKDTDNYEQIIKELKDGIDGEANSYITNMKLYAEYANKFPEASPESIVSAYMTEVAGYVDPEKMSEYEITIVGENGLETKTAKDFFDSVYDMNQDDRNRLLERLYNIVYGEESEYGDNEKSVAFGEMRALYTVSQNPEGYENDKYQGMLDADFFVTVLANFRPLGLNVGDVVHFISGGNLMSTKQEFLNQNDWARFIGLAGSVGASYGLFRGGTALIEKGLKLLPGTSQLFNASLEGQAGGGIATFLQEAEALGGANASGAVSTAAAASAAFKTIKIGIFDAALAGTKTLVSGTDFLTEFGQDFARDAILELVFSYYDMIQFEKAVNDSTVYVYKDPKTGNITIAPEYRERIFENAPEEEIDDLIEIPTYNEAGERIGAEYATKTTKTGGTSVYTPIGVRNIQKTRSGDIVGIAQSEIGTTYYYNGMAVTVTPDGETQKFLLGPDGTVDGIMDLRTGVADVKTTESTTLEGSLAQLGIPSDSIDIFSVPSQNAAAAQVAAKVAKFDSSKAGLVINKNLFNKNAVLDTANEIALAKTADLTAWQNRSQKFVSVTDNANQEKNLIRMGTYAPSAKKAFEEYQSLLGELNLTQRYSRADADYLKAIVQLERAAYLDRHKLEGETRNYTAEALEKYGEAIAKIPDDRAEVLKDFLQKRKNRNDAIKLSAKKSGKIDNKKLEDFTDSDLQKEIGWVPQWGKKQTYLGLLDKFYGVSQERNIYKAWLPDGGWIDLDKLEDPIVADDRFLNFITTNMGITNMISSAAEAFNDAGLLVDNTPTSATIRKKKLESIKNKDELKKKLDEMVEAKKKEVKEKVPSQKQYKDNMLALYEKHNIDESIERAISKPKKFTSENWKEEWKKATPALRKAIREELAKTSLQTGYGIKDTRARLNAQVPGADVLDWSLLGRDHTNGLVPGGLYARKNSTVKAYIMSVDDLAKLAGYDLDNAIPGMGKVIEKNINTEGGIPMLPAHIRGSGNGSGIWLKMRWGHNSDSAANWADYLKTIKERGIEKVPVAIDDAMMADSPLQILKNSSLPQKNFEKILKKIEQSAAMAKKLKISPRELSAASLYPGEDPFKIHDRIRRKLPLELFSEEDWADVAKKALSYDWSKDKFITKRNRITIEEIVEEELGKLPQDITSEVQQAFSEYGQIPFYHGQHKPLGSMEYNDPEGARGDAYRGAGDAYWLAPNSSYTDDYGKNKLEGTIPIKYFMSDKEKASLIQKLKKEYTDMRQDMIEKTNKLYNDFTAPIDRMIMSDSPLAKNALDLHKKSLIATSEIGQVVAQDLLAKGTPAQQKIAKRYISIKKILDYDTYTDEDIDNVASGKFKKDLKKYLELEKIVEGATDGEYDPRDIQSYRALAEYAGKPVIDISEDNFADGTAFFYYIGVNPEFDKEIGGQLVAQALAPRSPQWSEADIEKAMEIYDGMSLDEMIDDATMGQGFGEGWDDLFEQFNAGEISSSELSEEVSKFFKGVEKRYPGIGKVMQETWDNNTIQDLRDMKFKYWHPSTGYPTIDSNTAERFLEDMGERPVLASDISKDQLSLYDAIRPTANNIPNQPAFRQPKSVTYNDYEAGIKMDPKMVRHITDLIKQEWSSILISNVSGLLYEANQYLRGFGYTTDIDSYMNTSTIPNLKTAINNKDKTLAAAIVNQALLETSPYVSRSEVLKSQQDEVAQEWREWAEKHIKAGKASNKDLKKFADDNNLELPDDKRPLSSKIKHALWERLESGGKMPKIEGLDISKLRAKDNNTTSSVNREKVYKYGTFPDYSILPKSGHSVLYTNTPTKNLDSIQEKGLLVGRNIEKYPKSPEEGMVIWTDSTNPTTSNYGGNTVAFQVPSEELKKYAVNDTQHTIPHNIRREDILFIDKMYSAEPLIKASNIMSYVEKYGKDKTISVLKNKGADEEEIRNLIDVRSAGQSESGVTKESFYKMLDETPLFQSATKDKKELVDLVAAEINGETIDAYEMGTSTTALGLGGRYPITWYRKGKPYTRFLTYRNAEEQRLAEETVNLFTDKQLVKEPGIISRIASMAANDFRQLTTALDPTRAPLNFARDTGRGQVTSGGQSFINPSNLFKKLLEVGDYTAEEKEKLSQALDNVAEMVAGETYNAAYRSPKKTTVQATKEYLSKTGANPLRRFFYNVAHDKRGMLEKPADFFEGLTRKRLAKSAAVVKLGQLQKEGASFEEQLKGMSDAAFFAGREYTANFQRKGKLIGTTSKYVAYQSSAYAGFDGLKRAFINNPKAVSKNFAMFLIAYLILLADTLGDEGSRKNYYRLSEYDRGNSVVISLDDDTVLTIPLDQEIAGLLFPYRRFLETLNGVDPVSFFELMWGTITETLPLDLSGFTEGEGFNLARGLEKLTAQNIPNVITPIQEAASGYDLYYGSDLRVTDETLKDYGIYNPEAGDYTTAGKNSALLRRIANMTGIPQWQLQTMVDGYGGNVGSYVLNILDKLSGATEEAQGGKDFANAIFKSFVATDQDAASSAFYDGIKKLQQEKKKVIQQVANYNEDIKTATGSAKVELQNKLQKAKDDYATKVGDFVDKYISAYEITGGLSKSQAMQVYYLFRFDDDDTVYQTGSPEEYYNNQALQKFKNQATAMSAPILDKYYNNRIGNIYQNADGEWVRYLSSGAQAMRNSIYSQGEEHMVNLLNIIESKGSNLKALRTKVKKAREEAFKAKDYTTRDQLGYDFDLKVVEAISPYIEKYGAENVLGTSDVLDYLSDWFFVPDDFKRTKRGGYVSLGHNASTEEAFVRPYIKYLFGLPTNYYTYSETSLTSPSLGDFER